MALIEDLQQLAKLMPPSHSPTVAEVCDVVGAMAVFIEHGPQVLELAKKDFQEFSDLIGGGSSTPPPTIPGSVAGSAPTPVLVPVADNTAETDSLKAQLASTQQQLDTALAALKTLQANNPAPSASAPVAVDPPEAA